MTGKHAAAREPVAPPGRIGTEGIAAREQVRLAQQAPVPSSKPGKKKCFTSGRRGCGDASA